MRISDWSSDVCSSDLPAIARDRQPLVIAETRDLLAGKLARLQHGGASGHFDLDAINFELGHCGAVLDNHRQSGWRGSAGAVRLDQPVYCGERCRTARARARATPNVFSRDATTRLRNNLPTAHSPATASRDHNAPKKS